jgi:hypothetical protein
MKFMMEAALIGHLTRRLRRFLGGTTSETRATIFTIMPLGEIVRNAANVVLVIDKVATSAAFRNLKEASLFTSTKKKAIFTYATCFLFVFNGCSNEESAAAKTSSTKAGQPFLHIVGDSADVGSIVYIDGKKAVVFKDRFLSPVREYVPIDTGRRVVEIRNKDELRLRKVILVAKDSGQISLPARVEPPASPDLSPNE